jgi:hypothetical protein
MAKLIISGVKVEVEGNTLTKEDKKPNNATEFEQLCSVFLALSAQGTSLSDEDAQNLCDTIVDAWGNIDEEDDAFDVPDGVEVELILYATSGDAASAVVDLDSSDLREIFSASQKIYNKPLNYIGVAPSNAKWFEGTEQEDIERTEWDSMRVYATKAYLHSQSRYGNFTYTSEGVAIDDLKRIVREGGGTYEGELYKEMKE